MNPEELKVLEERIKANPKSRSFLQLAEAYIEAGRKKEALELLKNGEEYYPYYLAARIAYGKLLREEGETDRAIEQFEFVNRTIPDNLIALKNLAPLYFEKSRLPEAKAMATSALALSPGDPEMTEIIQKVDAASAASSPPPPPPAPPQPEPKAPEEVAEPLSQEPEPATEAPAAPAPEETIVEMPHELFEKVAAEAVPEEPKQAAPAPPKESALPQTETMGDLLVNQGHIEEAMAVYEAVLAKDPGNKTVPEKLHSVRTMLRLIPPAEPTPPLSEPPVPEPTPEPAEEIPAEPQEEQEPEPSPAPEPEPEPEPLPEPLKEEAPPTMAEPEPEEQEPEPEVPYPPAPAPEPVAPSAPPSLPEGVAGKIVDAVQKRMGRAFTGYVRASLDGLSVETSDSGQWGDILAAEGVEIVRAVSDMTRMLGWGDLQGTVVWMDRATLYGLPIGTNEALFLALKPGTNIGLCRLLVARTIEEALKDQE